MNEGEMISEHLAVDNGANHEKRKQRLGLRWNSYKQDSFVRLYLDRFYRQVAGRGEDPSVDNALVASWPNVAHCRGQDLPDDVSVSAGSGHRPDEQNSAIRPVRKHCDVLRELELFEWIGEAIGASLALEPVALNLIDEQLGSLRMDKVAHGFRAQLSTQGRLPKAIQVVSSRESIPDRSPSWRDLERQPDKVFRCGYVLGDRHQRCSMSLQLWSQAGR